MFTRLFNRDEVEAYQLDQGVSEYDHAFGGEAYHEGTVPPDWPKPVHLFYNLGLSDPHLGIRSPHPNLKYLPLYYALGNLGGPFRYRVLSDTRIELHGQPYPQEYRAGILKVYPEPFPLAPVELNPIGYNPNNPQHVWDSGGVLGIAKLTTPQKATLKKKMERWHLEKIGCPLVEKDDEDEPDPPLEEIVAGCTPFTQGMPNEKCPNPKCAQHQIGTPLPPLLLLEPEEGDGFYEMIAGGDDGQLIWQVCHRCATVVVTNPCT